MVRARQLLADALQHLGVGLQVGVADLAVQLDNLLQLGDCPIDRISRLVGHSGTTVTETVYRKQIRPVITDGAETMDRLFPNVTERESSDEATSDDATGSASGA